MTSCVKKRDILSKKYFSKINVPLFTLNNFIYHKYFVKFKQSRSKRLYRAPTLIWGCPQRQKGHFSTIKKDKQDIFAIEKRTNKAKFEK